MPAFNFASKRVALRAIRALLLTTAAGRRFAIAPTGNTFGDTFIGVHSETLGRFHVIAGCAANGRVDPLAEVLIDGKPAISESDWVTLPTDPFAPAFA